MQNKIWVIVCVLLLFLSLTILAPSHPKNVVLQGLTYARPVKNKTKIKLFTSQPYFLAPYEIMWCSSCILHRYLW